VAREAGEIPTHYTVTRKLRRLLAVLPVHLPAKRRASVCAIGIRHAQNCLGLHRKGSAAPETRPLDV